MEQNNKYIRLAADLQSDSIVDGPGLRAVLWTQGCSHHCPGCQNPQTWDFNGGGLVPISMVLDAIDELEYQDGITFSGGDPMFQPKACFILAKKIHELGMNVWAYTGFTYEELRRSENKDIHDFLSEIDVLIDGRFDINKKSMDLKFRGSSNQRLIDMNKTRERRKLTLYDLDTRKDGSSLKTEKLYI